MLKRMKTEETYHDDQLLPRLPQTLPSILLTHPPMTAFSEGCDPRDIILWSKTKEEDMECFWQWRVLRLCEGDAGATSDRGEKSEKLDLMIC